MLIFVHPTLRSSHAKTHVLLHVILWKFSIGTRAMGINFNVNMRKHTLSDHRNACSDAVHTFPPEIAASISVFHYWKVPECNSRFSFSPRRRKAWEYFLPFAGERVGILKREQFYSLYLHDKIGRSVGCRRWFYCAPGLCSVDTTARKTPSFIRSFAGEASSLSLSLNKCH